MREEPLDEATRSRYFITAVIAVLVLAVGGVVLLVYLLLIEAMPPSQNMLWEWQGYPLGYDEDTFMERVRPGILLFGATGLTYIVALACGIKI